MNKIFLLLLFLIFSSMLFAQNQPLPRASLFRQPSKREIAIKQIDITVEKSTVLELLRKILLEIKKGKKNGEVLSSSQYSIYCIKLESCFKYRWFIADTGLSRKWFKNAKKLVDYMQKTRGIIETATINGYTQTAKYKQAVKYFDVAYERFVKLLKKPVKVSGKSQRSAKVKKVLWQKAMRKKYKIDKKAQSEIP